MSKNKLHTLIIISIMLTTSITFANDDVDIHDQLTIEQAFEKGKLLYEQYKLTEAKPLLKYAADNGHGEAALLYSAANNKTPIIQSPAEYEYAVIAAELGNINGMIKSLRGNNDLYSDPREKKWHNKIMSTLLPHAKNNSGEAMYVLYNYTHDLDWLEKAAKADWPEAKSRLARSYEFGDGWFLIPGKRERETERLYKEASDADNLYGMYHYSKLLAEKGHIEESYKIRQKMINTGDASIILIMAILHFHNDESIPHHINKKLTAAKYYNIYTTSMGNEKKTRFVNNARDRYAELLNELSDDEIKEVNTFAEKFLSEVTVREIVWHY